MVYNKQIIAKMKQMFNARTALHRWLRIWIAAAAILMMNNVQLRAQGLEGIFVEKYYVSNSADSANASNALSGAEYSTGTLPSGSVTWRIYADLAPGWGVQAVFGENTHPLRITTTTQFFNHPNGSVGPLAANGFLSQGTTILDSYVSCGGVTSSRFAVVKTEDNVAGGTNLSFGAGILTNNDPSAAPALSSADGVYNTALNPPLTPLTSLGDVATALADVFSDGSVIGNSFVTTNSSWGVLGEQVGAFPSSSNRVLIGQFTTNGEFSYDLNIQIRNTTTAQVIKYVNANPASGEVLFPALSGTRFPQSPFTSGNLVVLQVGDGSAALSNAATAVFLREFNASIPGSAINSVAMPANARLTGSGTATSEGYITRSLDSTLIILSGYDAAVGTPGVATSTSATNNRNINQVNLCGTVQRAAGTSSLLSANNIRSAVKGNLNDYWGSGGNGVAYFGTQSAASGVSSSNARVLGIFNGELYFTSGSATILGLNKFTSLPLTTASPVSVFSTGTGSSPYGFAINPAGNIIYVADDRATAGAGGIQKWTLSGATWSLAYTLSTITGTSNTGARGLTVDFSGTNPVIYATTVEANANRLVRITDAGAGSTATLLSTATTNTVFRGVTFAPKPCAPALLSAAVANVACTGTATGSIDLSANSCSVPLSYQWSNGATTQDISGLVAGSYTVTVTSSGGCTSSAVYTVTQPAALTISSFTPGNGVAGDTITINGTGFTGVTQVRFNGISAGYQVVSASQIKAAVPSGSASGLIRIIRAGCDSVSSSTAFSTITTATLNVKAFIQGYFDGVGNAAALLNAGIGTIPTESDTLVIELRDPLSPSTIVASSTALLGTDGQAAVTMPGSLVGNNYYIALLHRNAVQTWSATPVTISNTTTYDFSIAATQAFGSNMTEVIPGVWALYSGDLVPQDEVVDFFDQVVLDNDVATFAAGYTVSDLTGDGLVDFFDQVILDNNIQIFVSSVHP